MKRRLSAASALKSARVQAGLTQRQLAKNAGTAQSVVARVESGETSPSIDTLTSLLKAAGFSMVSELERIRSIDRSLMDDVPRILGMTPEDRLREVAQMSRFVTAARRV